MEGIADVLKDGKELLKNFYSNDKTDDKKIENEDVLRTEVMTFVFKQMGIIGNQDRLSQAVEAELLNKVALHELSTDELMDVYRSISNEKSINTDVLLSLFKPSGASGTSSLMLPPSKVEEKTTMDLNSEQRNALDKLTRILTSMNEKKMEEEV